MLESSENAKEKRFKDILSPGKAISGPTAEPFWPSEFFLSTDLKSLPHSFKISCPTLLKNDWDKEPKTISNDLMDKDKLQGSLQYKP